MAESYSLQATLSAVDKNFTSTMQKATGTTGELDKGMEKTNTSILDIAKGVGVFKLIEVGVSAVTNSLGSAIERFDTLNQYPKVLESLGASAEESDRGIQILSDGIDGLPTKLDEVAATSQQMFLVFRDADKASESTIALNNALLASGSSGDKAARGTEQYLKMLRTGKVDLDTWTTLQETMGIGLDKVAKEMLGAEASTSDLYDALKDGTISIDDFNSALVGMSDELGDLARVNTKGIGTSFSNMANAISKGVANTIKALDNLVKTSGINADGIAGIFDVLKGSINKAFNSINKAIEGASPYVEGFMKAVSKLTPVVPPLTIALLALTASFVTLKVIGTVTAMMGSLNKATLASNVSMAAYDATMKKAESSTLLFKAAQLAVKGVGTLVTGVIGGLKTVYQLLTKQTTIATVAQSGFAGVTTLVSTATKGLYAALGPVGIAMGIVSAVAAGLAFYYKKSTEESKKLKEEQEQMSESLASSAEAYDQNISKIVAQSKAVGSLQEEILTLTGQEHKSVEQKELLRQKIEELNGKVKGLGLAYNEEANSLSLSSEQIQKRIDLQQKQEMGNAAEERLIELQQKRTEVTEKLKKAEAEVQELEDTGLAYGINYRNMVQTVTDAKENQNEIEEKIAQATNTRNEGIKASQEALQLAQQTMVEQQKVNYESLTASQQTAFDTMQQQYESLRSSVTNAFDQIQQKEAISLEQMAENLTKNAEAVQMWADNVAILAERGVDQGLISQLEKMGPEGAQQAALLVQSSDAELQKLSETYSNSVKTANEAMVRTAGEGSQPFVDAMSDTVNKASTGTKQTFQTSDLFTLGGQITGTIKNDIEKGSTEVESASKGLVDKATTPLDDLKPKLYNSGKEAPSGLAQGIQDNTEVVGKAAQDMGNKVDNQLRSSLDIHSPSRVMISNGKFIVQGLAQGITENSTEPVKNITEIAEKMKSNLTNLPDEFNSIGNHTMQGFAEGINEGGEQAISNANRIANDVADTMKKALDIHSPSRVMMKIGGFIGEGLAIGMEKSKKIVADASNTLSNASMNMGYNPQMASELSSFGSSQEFHISIESNLDGKVIARETIVYTAEELLALQNKKNTAVGRR